MSALTTPTLSNMREKKRKRNEQKETPTSDWKPNKGKDQDHLKKTSLGPLRQGQRLDTSETKPCSSKEHKPPKQNSKNHKELPCTYAISPWTNATPPGRMHAKHLKKSEQLHQLSSHRSDQSPPPVRPVLNMCIGPTLWPVRLVTSTGQTGAQQSPKMARNHLKTF
jgi:hypothetical protein